MAETAMQETEEGSNLSVVDDADVIPNQKEEAIRRTTRVRELREESNELFLSYAEEMYHINKHGLHNFVENPQTEKKYTSFKEFVETETEYKVRRARYMIAIWEWYVIEHDRSFLEDLQSYGWTKLSKLVGRVTPENFEAKWKGRLEDMSVRDIESAIEEEKSPKEKGQIEKEPNPEGMRTDPTNRVTFQLFDQQHSNLNLALKAASAMTDSNSKGENLEVICLDFLSEHHSSNEANRPMDKLLQSIESNLGINIIAIKDRSIAYGGDHLDRLEFDGEEEEGIEEI